MSSQITPASVKGTVQKTKVRHAPKPSYVKKLPVIFASMVVAFTVLCAIFPSLIATSTPTEMDSTALLQGPGIQHLFGTDHYGRDVFSLVVYGSRESLIVGIASVLVGAVIGGAIGLIAGYAGGVTEMLLMRFIDILMTLPGILLALTIAAVLGPSTMNVIIAVSISSVPSYARIMRSQVLSVKSRTFIDAAQAVGTSHTHILFRHILPNSLSPLLVVGTVGVGVSILVSSGLSFLGLGSQGEIPGWGQLLSDGRDYLTVAWWIATFPGLAITLLVLSVNLIGDELRDIFDPKISHKR